MGAVNRINEAFHNANIRVFAAMRTISDPEHFSDLFDECTGKIELKGVNTFRNP